jgi:hypothetical protein
MKYLRNSNQVINSNDLNLVYIMTHCTFSASVQTDSILTRNMCELPEEQVSSFMSPGHFACLARQNCLHLLGTK